MICIFYKYEASGNDFILIEDYHEDYQELAKKLCEAHYSIGADGLIVYLNNPLEMKIFNKDGSNAKMCGNGLRIFAYHHYLKTKETKFNVIVSGEEKECLIKDDLITIALGEGKNFKKIGDNHYIELGVPHIITFHEDFCNLSNVMLQNANIDYVKVYDQKSFQIKTCERGVGYTKACGSGAGAAFLILRSLGLIDKMATVYFDNDAALIYEDEKIYLSGKVKLVFRGEMVDG